MHSYLEIILIIGAFTFRLIIIFYQLLFFGSLSFVSSSQSAFVKLNSDGTKVWSKSINFQAFIRSLALDKTESSVYFIKNSSGLTLIVGRLKTSDGTLADAQS